MWVSTRVYKIEALYGRLCVNIEIEPYSTFMFMFSLSYYCPVYFIYVCTHPHKNYSTVEIHLKTLKFAFEMFFALLYNVSATKYFAFLKN